MIALVLPLCLVGLVAQSAPSGAPPMAPSNQPFGSTPPVGHPVVFLLFMSDHESLEQSIEELTESDPGGAQEVRKSAAVALQLSLADFQKLRPVYRQLASTLQAIDREADAYRDAVIARTQVLDPVVPQQFYARKIQAIAAAKAQLKSALTPAGWTSLSAYIDGEFRKTIVRRPLGQ